MQGMTIKQLNRKRFYDLLDAYREAKKDISTPDKKATFIRLSVALHQAKAGVPKSLWPLVTRAYSE
jgi:hypothetical protein